jgi:hypothetical protein
MRQDMGEGFFSDCHGLDLPGIEKDLARYLQLHSQWRFMHQFGQLGGRIARKKCGRLGSNLPTSGKRIDGQSKRHGEYPARQQSRT